MFNGTIKAFNPHKGWGFVDCHGQDMFLHKKNLKGFCPSKGNQVQFTVGQTEKGPVAENVKVVSPPEETSFYGSIKSFNHWTGYGFISSEAFDQDVFVLWWDLPFGFGPRGSPCKFSISMDAKGPAAKKVVLLGAAGSQIQQVEWMMGGFDTTCWDLNKNGTCPRAAEGKCRWHPCKAGACAGMESRLVKTCWKTCTTPCDVICIAGLGEHPLQTGEVASILVSIHWLEVRCTIVDREVISRLQMFRKLFSVRMLSFFLYSWREATGLWNFPERIFGLSLPALMIRAWMFSQLTPFFAFIVPWLQAMFPPVTAILSKAGMR